METVVIVLNSTKLENPDLDIVYNLPDKVKRYSNNELCDGGYDYLSNTEIGIWFTTQSARDGYKKLIGFLENHMVCGNDLLQTAKIYISDKERAILEECTLVYDGEEEIQDEGLREKNKAQKAGRIILKLAELIVQEDKSVLEPLTTMIGKIENMDKQWKCFVETLKEQHYLMECDMDTELDAFLEMLIEMKMVKKNALSIQKDRFNVDEEVDDWCDILSEQWEKAGFGMAAFDLDDDNEVVFPCRTENAEEIIELAGEIGIFISADID